MTQIPLALQAFPLWQGDFNPCLPCQREVPPQRRWDSVKIHQQENLSHRRVRRRVITITNHIQNPYSVTLTLLPLLLLKTSYFVALNRALCPLRFSCSISVLLFTAFLQVVQRIDRRTVLAHFKMKMRPCRVTGRAYTRDQFAFTHHLSLTDKKRRIMRI